MSEPSDPSTEQTPAAAPGLSSGPAPVRRGLGPLAPLLVAILALAAVASVAYIFTRDGRGRRPGVSGPAAALKPGVAILPFPPASGAEETAWVGQAAFQFLPLALENSTELRVLTPERLRDLSGGDPPTALPAQRDLARKGGADFFLRGEVSGKPGAATLKASWIETASGLETERWTVEGIGPENLGRKMDELYGHLRKALRLEAPGSTEPPLVSLVPVKEAPTRSYLEASSLLAKGDTAGCLKALGEALALSDFHLARFLQAEAAARAGDPATAVAAATPLAKVARPLPARVVLLTPAILGIYGSRNPRSGVEPLESFLARFPDEKYALSWLGAIELLLLHEPERAMEHLKKSLEMDPSNLDTRRLLGRAILKAGRAAEAIPILEEFLKARPEDDGARLLLSDAQRRSGRPDEARRTLEEILSRRPEDAAAVDSLGSLLLEQDRTGAAEALYAGLARAAHTATRVQGEFLLGRFSLLQGRFNEGIRRYRAAAELSVEAGDPAAQSRNLMALGEVLSFLGRNQEALEALGEIRGIVGGGDPGLSIINVLVAQKQYDMARKLLGERAGRWQGKTSAEALKRLEDALEGTIALEQGNYKEALKRIEASVPEPGKEPPESEILGRTYLGAGDAARAEKIFRKITEDPNRFSDPMRYVRSLVRLGEACEKLGRKEEALKYYRQALRWWGSADHTLPVMSQAREGIKRLGE